MEEKKEEGWKQMEKRGWRWILLVFFFIFVLLGISLFLFFNHHHFRSSPLASSLKTQSTGEIPVRSLKDLLSLLLFHVPHPHFEGGKQVYPHRKIIQRVQVIQSPPEEMSYFVWRCLELMVQNGSPIVGGDRPIFNHSVGIHDREKESVGTRIRDAYLKDFGNTIAHHLIPEQIYHCSCAREQEIEIAYGVEHVNPFHVFEDQPASIIHGIVLELLFSEANQSPNILTLPHSSRPQIIYQFTRPDHFLFHLSDHWDRPWFMQLLP